MDGKSIIYTIGYTSFQTSRGVDLDGMFGILRDLCVTHLIDVRSIPFSKQYPECNANYLKEFCKHSPYGTRYGHMPELGAKVLPVQEVFSKAEEIFFDDIFPIAKSNRPEKTKLQKDDEIVDFSKFRNSENLKDGLRRIERAYDQNYTIALMCSEKDPVDCHRYFLVSRKLEQEFGNWLRVVHITKNKADDIITLTNDEVNKELSKIVLNRTEIKKLDVLTPTLLEPAKIDKYFGSTQKEQILDFCDRYWNLMHGWKKYPQMTTNTQEYDYFV